MMIRCFLYGALFVPLALAQAVAPAPSDPASLPQITVGIGPSWTRGDVHAASADVDVAVKLGSCDCYSWSTLSTPVARVPAGSPPLASTITTGIAYIPTRSPNGAVSLVTIAQGGLNSVQANGTAAGSTSLAVTGSVGLAIRLGKGNLYLMPYIKASKPERGTDGSLVSAVIQPGIMLVYGFSGGGK